MKAYHRIYKFMEFMIEAFRNSKNARNSRKGIVNSRNSWLMASRIPGIHGDVKFVFLEFPVGAVAMGASGAVRK